MNNQAEDLYSAGRRDEDQKFHYHLLIAQEKFALPVSYIKSKIPREITV